MNGTAKEYRYPLRLALEDETEIAELVKRSGQSINSVLVLCIRKGLPIVRQALCQNSGRVTAIEPLPESVLERIYAQKDELQDVTAEQLIGFQSQTEPQ
jgi:hypothetical protein